MLVNFAIPGLNGRFAVFLNYFHDFFKKPLPYFLVQRLMGYESKMP